MASQSEQLAKKVLEAAIGRVKAWWPQLGTKATNKLADDLETLDLSPILAEAEKEQAAANLTEDQRVAVEFYTLNPSAALLDLNRRISRTKQADEWNAAIEEVIQIVVKTCVVAGKSWHFGTALAVQHEILETINSLKRPQSGKQELLNDLKEAAGLAREVNHQADVINEIVESSRQSDAVDVLLEEYVELVFQCARYQRPSTDWREAGQIFLQKVAAIHQGLDPTYMEPAPDKNKEGEVRLRFFKNMSVEDRLRIFEQTGVLLKGLHPQAPEWQQEIMFKELARKIGIAAVDRMTPFHAIASEEDRKIYKSIADNYWNSTRKDQETNNE